MPAFFFTGRSLPKVGIGCLSFCSLFTAASDYGVRGYIDMPSALMSADGTLSGAASVDGRHRQFSVTYQATPWLEGTFRYTGFQRFFHYDRNYEVKAQLLREGPYIPALSVGIRDLVGTGVFGSEYIVGTKTYNRHELSVGMGWGRLAGNQAISNPAEVLDDRFGNRVIDYDDTGQFSLGNYFSGKTVGLFAGYSYEIPGRRVKLIAEYNSDNYDFDRFRAGESQAPKSPVSLAARVKLSDDSEVLLSYQNNEEIGVSLTYAVDTKKDPVQSRRYDFESSLMMTPNSLPPQLNPNSWYDRLLYDVERSGLLLVEAKTSADEREAYLVVGNADHRLWVDAMERHVALADLHLPADIDRLHFILEEAGHRVATLTYSRPSYSGSRSRLVNFRDGATLQNPNNRTSFRTGKIHSEINFGSRFQLFDPTDPARYQLFAALTSEYAISNYWAVRSRIVVDLYNNFGDSKRKSDSVLPRVRSDIVEYLTKGESGIDSLIMEGRNSIRKRHHYRVFSGLLEESFAGVGLDYLYAKPNSRLALGVSGAYVQQREYDKLLKLKDYSVFTGFISAYWATPFYNYDAAVHVGRYLAGDHGSTVELRRTFRNGWQVGVWATLTNVPFNVFGEGAFDKGFFFQIPLNLNKKGRSVFATRVRPIQRDGGQRLEDFSGGLFWTLRGARYDAFYDG